MRRLSLFLFVIFLPSIAYSGAPAFYSEDFESYAAGADPSDWYDSAAGNSLLEDDSLFKVFDLGGNKALGTTSEATNIYSHYTAAGSDALANYRFTGRMMMTDPGGGIGITFKSQFPTEVSYYRLRRYFSNAFHLTTSGTGISGGTTDTGVVPAAGVWYRFKVEIQDTGSQTEIRAKVWQDGTTEPGDWQVDAYDANPTRLTAGTFGVWSFANGSKYWDDLTLDPLVPPPPSQLTVGTVGDGSVTVDPDLPEYSFGQVVTLTAVPADANWAFTGWSGNLSGFANPANLAMTGDKVVTATFTPVSTHTLTVNTVGSGSVTVDPVQAVYTTGQVVTLTPVPADNSWEFTGWSGDLTGSTNPAALMMDGDKVVTATFVPVSLEWGSIDITRSGSDWVVELENSLIYVKYGFSQIKQGEPYDRIIEFVVKSRNTLVADKLDGRQSNSPTIYTITNATVTFDGPDRKTVRITFGNNQRVTNVTMFRGSPVLRLDYQSGGHNLDYGIVGNTWKIYGAEAWQALNGWPITYPTLQDNITFSGSYYRDQWGDPGPLSYNGSMIMGLYNSSTGFGAGLVLSFADDIRFLKLIDPGDGKGFERWIDGGAHTAYLYPVTGGAAELISLGKQIVDDDFLD